MKRDVSIEGGSLPIHYGMNQVEMCRELDEIFFKTGCGNLPHYLFSADTPSEEEVLPGPRMNNSGMVSIFNMIVPADDVRVRLSPEALRHMTAATHCVLLLFMSR